MLLGMGTISSGSLLLYPYLMERANKGVFSLTNISNGFDTQIIVRL